MQFDILDIFLIMYMNATDCLLTYTSIDSHSFQCETFQMSTFLL